MPYIQINTNMNFDRQQKEELSRQLTARITTLTNKRPESTMVEINDDKYMFFQLNEEPCMKIRIELFRKSELSEKRAYVEEIMKLISAETGVDIYRIYLSIGEYDNWGSKGTLRE